MVEGAWELLPSAEVWHIGLYRDERTLKPVEYYNKLPVEPTVSVCLILDPMLATGGSAVATVDVLKRWGVRRIKFVGLIGAPEGIALLQQRHPEVPIHLAAIDQRLNKNGYILPGLGDAGDRQFGTACQIRDLFLISQKRKGIKSLLWALYSSKPSKVARIRSFLSILGSQ